MRQKMEKEIIRSFTTCLPRTFLPPMSRTVLAPTLVGQSFQTVFSLPHLCAHLQYVRNAYQSKRKTVFQFLILFLKVVVLVRIAVRELVDLNFSVRQLLTMET